MAILKIQKKGQKIKIQNLEEGQEYFIGRDKKNTIVTPSSHGISRKHLKLSQTEDKKWKIECLSSLGGLIVQSEETKEYALEPGDSFYLKDYIFHFVEENLDESEKQIEKEPDEPLSVEDENSMKEEQQDNASSSPDKESDTDSLDNVFESKNHSFDHAHTQKSKIEEISDENKLEQNPDNKNEEQQDEDLVTQPMHNELKINPPSEKTHSTTAHTKIASDQNLQPTLVVSLDEDEEDQVIPLVDGHLWVVGRDPSSDICIEDHNISRQHFEIKQEERKFYITDLGSSNGTCLNDMALAPYKPHLLESGSVINILEVEIYFDIINKSIQKASTNLPVTHSNKDLIPIASDQPSNNSPLPAAIPNVIMDQTLMTSVSDIPASKKKKFIGIGLIIASLLIVGVALNSKKEPVEEVAQPTEMEDSEDNKKIKDLYTLAHQLFRMKKYKLCYEKLNLLLTLTPQYKDSEKLMKSCKNGYDNQLTQLEIERRNKEQEKIDKAIADNIKDCTQKFPSFQTLENLKECLKTTIEHDPQHPEVWNLTSKFEDIETEKKRLLEQRKERDKQKNRELAVYNKAKALKEKNRVLQAIDAYKSFLNRKSAHIISDTVTIAKQELEEMENELNNKVDQSMSSCESLMSEQNYKEAYIACKNVTHILPAHKEATAHMNTAILEINKQLKPLYEESVINESLGNITAAKKLWNSIVDQDIPLGNYATKAQTKLDKY